MPPSAIDKGKLRSICETNLDKVTVILPTTLAFVPYSTQWILIFYCYRPKEIYRVEEWECLNPTNSLQLLLLLVSCSSLMYQNILISQRATHQYHFSRFQVNFFWFSFPLCLWACKSLWHCDKDLTARLWTWQGLRKPHWKPRKSCATLARSPSTFVNLAVFEVN